MTSWEFEVGRGQALHQYVVPVYVENVIMSKLISGSVGVALVCVCVTAVVSVQSHAVAPAFSRTELAAPPMSGWPTNGGNWSSQRYSPLTEITRDNVARLKGVWRTRLRG